MEKDLNVLESEGKLEETAPEGNLETEGEKAEDEVVPETKAEEEGKEEGGEGDVVEKEPYTAEELEALLEEGSDIDTSRLSDEGKILNKSFQRGYTKKFEQLAEDKRNLGKGEAQPTQLSQKEQWFQRYMQDPDGVTKEFNAEKRRLEGQMEHEKATELQEIKDEFQIKRERIKEAQDYSVRVESALAKEIPDIAERKPKLVEYAQKELGLSPEEIGLITNPHVVGGPLSIKVTKAVNKFLKIAEASQTASKKVKKKVPARLEGGGAGGGVKKPARGADEAPTDMKEFKKWDDDRRRGKLKQARESFK